MRQKPVCSRWQLAILRDLPSPEHYELWSTKPRCPKTSRAPRFTPARTSTSSPTRPRPLLGSNSQPPRQAAPWFEEGFYRRASSPDDPTTLPVSVNLGIIELMEGHSEQARRVLQEALRVAQDLEVRMELEAQQAAQHDCDGLPSPWSTWRGSRFVSLDA